MKNKRTKLNLLATMSKSYAEDCYIISDLKKEDRRDNGAFPSDSIKEAEPDWPIAHYIGANSYNFNGKESQIETAIGLAGYLPVAHKSFNDFYGSLKGGEDNYLKFNNLERRSKMTKSYCSSKDIIICPWDSHYKPVRDWELFKKIESEEIMLDSIELAKKINKRGLKNKVDLIIYDKSFYISPLRELVNDEMGEYEEDQEEIQRMKNISKKYGINFVEKIEELPFPYLLYEHLRNNNKDLFWH
ncbi:MAG: hypothetical protein PF542_06365 [Nanoarchaeota archaeon]|jgi:hypothetical protein|nr:hypothetical protein [Nanoarchaeota archaeon]